jgi:hypothetical protein
LRSRRGTRAQRRSPCPRARKWGRLYIRSGSRGRSGDERGVIWQRDNSVLTENAFDIPSHLARPCVDGVEQVPALPPRASCGVTPLACSDTVEK